MGRRVPAGQVRPDSTQIMQTELEEEGMKYVWLRLIVLAMLVLALGAVGCAKKQVAQTPEAAGADTPAVSGSETTGMTTTDSATVDELAAQEKQLAEAKQIIMTEKIFFDFDKYDLKDSSRDMLKRKAEALKKHKNLRILIEGHCDERGTQEYNLALGERRARAAYEFLILLGVNPSQLEMVSFGEEKPAVKGSTEAAWAKNRRCEFRVL